MEKVKRKKEKLNDLVFQVITIEGVTQNCSLQEAFSEMLPILSASLF